MPSLRLCLPCVLLCLPLACGDDPPAGSATSAGSSDSGEEEGEAGEEGEEGEEGEAGEEGEGSGSTTDDPSTSGDPTGDPTSGSTTDDTSDTAGCTYPAGAVEPMTLGEVITPYTWPNAIHNDGSMAPLDLADAPCGNDGTIEWSPFDVLLFISIPAW